MKSAIYTELYPKRRSFCLKKSLVWNRCEFVNVIIGTRIKWRWQEAAIRIIAWYIILINQRGICKIQCHEITLANCHVVLEQITLPRSFIINFQPSFNAAIMLLKRAFSQSISFCIISPLQPPPLPPFQSPFPLNRYGYRLGVSKLDGLPVFSPKSSLAASKMASGGNARCTFRLD